jgi:hypothetical protein
MPRDASRSGSAGFVVAIGGATGRLNRQLRRSFQHPFHRVAPWHRVCSTEGNCARSALCGAANFQPNGRRAATMPSGSPCTEPRRHTSLPKRHTLPTSRYVGSLQLSRNATVRSELPVPAASAARSRSRTRARDTHAKRSITPRKTRRQPSHEGHDRAVTGARTLAPCLLGKASTALVPRSAGRQNFQPPGRRATNNALRLAMYGATFRAPAR